MFKGLGSVTIAILAIQCINTEGVGSRCCVSTWRHQDSGFLFVRDIAKTAQCSCVRITCKIRLWFTNEANTLNYRKMEEDV
jgi:hypothetical protein